MDLKIADNKFDQHLTSPEWKKLLFLGEEPLTRVSLECIFQDLRIGEPNKTCIQYSTERGSWFQPVYLQDDLGTEKDKDIQSGSARRRSDAEGAEVNRHDCRCDQNRRSRNETKCTGKSSLRLRLQVKQEDDSRSKGMDVEGQRSSGWGRHHDQARGSTDVVKEGTEGCRGIDSTTSVEVNLSMPRSKSRYNLRPRPERRRRHYSEDLQKVIKREPSGGRRLECREIKETDKKEAEEDTGHETGCARADFVYKRNERPRMLPEAPVPLLGSKRVRFLTRGCENNRRSERKEVKLVISLSSIHGNGVFTKQEIVAGRTILEFVGEKIRNVISDLREKRYEEQSEQSCYMFSSETGMVIDSTRKGSMGRFINHCCSPNAVAKCVKGRIFVYAKRLIAEGEEITMDYGRGDGSGERKCKCGAVRCRGVVAV